jgi:hypothetical protein
MPVTAIASAAHVPKSRKRQEKNGISDNRIWDREKGDRTGPECQRRNGNKGVGRIKVAADQEPGDDGAEATSSEPPFVQQVEVTLPPPRSSKAQPGYQGEQHQENDQGSPIHILHGSPPEWFSFVIFSSCVAVFAVVLIFRRKMDDCGQDGSNNDPQ